MAALALRGLCRVAVLCLVAMPMIGFAQMPEPETIFFGRIINRSSGQEYQLRDGVVSWTITGGGVTPLTVTAPIQSLQGGAYSYKLKVPHQAKSLDSIASGASLPLKPADVEFETSGILVNGEPAVPLNGSFGFAASQPKRGAVHRLDLEVFHALDDSDGDGIPDWWEDLYGLNKQWAGDAHLHFGDNHYSYLQAFRLGLDPRVDDRLPQLLTNEVTVMSEGVTGLLLRTVASTTAPAQIRYRLVGLPPGGAVVLRGARPDPKLAHRTLKSGDIFTQADVDAGLVEFSHLNPAVTSSSLKLEIVSLNRPTQPITREVAVLVYRPDPAEGRAGARWANEAVASGTLDRGNASDRWRQRATSAFAGEWAGAGRQKNEIAAFLVSRWFDYTVWDGRAELPSRNLAVPSSGLSAREYTAFVQRFGPARHHLIFAGDGTVRIDGGMNGDILIAGKTDTTMRGNGGADFFVANRGKLVIEDFKKSDGDVLDLSDLLHGAPGALAERVEVSLNGGNTQLRIPLDDGEAALITLQGVKLAQKDLETWRRSGNLFTGDLSSVKTPENRAPFAVDDEGYVAGGQPVSIPVLLNDGDVDGDVVTIESVTPGRLGTTEIMDGTILYTPGPGFAGHDDFTYTITDGRGGTAIGRVKLTYPYPAAAGSYVPVVLSADGAPVGKMQVRLLPSGGFTVKLSLRGIDFTGKGEFDGEGQGELVLQARGVSLTVKLSLDLTDPTFPLSGEISGGGNVDHLLTAAAGANGKDKLPKALKFTFALHAPSGEPATHSVATVHVARNSATRIVGKLADGTPFSTGAMRLTDGAVRWTVHFKKGEGWLLGSWNLHETPDSAPGGSTQWVRTATVAGAGFNRLLPTSGSLYVAPSVAAVSALDFADSTARFATLSLRNGGIVDGLDTTLELKAGDKIQAPAGSSLLLRLNRQSGLWSGTVTLDGEKSPVRGVILQNQNRGFGYFLNGGHSGSSEIVPQ